ncbi:MAG: tyrosine-type recombinase/integrase [Bacteroidales bacterium]|nr:tyrosine-type recombinase/integrase [Bacteroidales bacterium]
MPLKNQFTTSDYIPWAEMLSLVHKLYRDGDYRFSCLIACGCGFGLRIGDLLRISTWAVLLDNEQLDLVEEKTGKHRILRINPNLQRIIKDCYNALGCPNKGEHCFINHRGTIYSREWVNRHLKAIKAKYGLSVEHLSSHSFRKTFGRHVVEMSKGQEEHALIVLSELFSHNSVATTRKYLGLRAQELGAVYDKLDF